MIRVATRSRGGKYIVGAPLTVAGPVVAVFAIVQMMFWAVVLTVVLAIATVGLLMIWTGRLVGLRWPEQGRRLQGAGRQLYRVFG